ncbi:Rad51-domain-containing protein [Cyathus striatus]|nr:Rad51-domain-containing protein [Cyathus striatus]
MQAESLINLSSFSASQRILLAKGKIRTVGDLLLSPLQDVSRRCKVSPLEAQRLIETFCLGQESNKICQLSVSNIKDEVFTTGDSLLDEALKGGIRTSMLWDVSGESAAGKTQLGLQLSLCVQLPLECGGLSGSTCYLTTSSTLPTNRLLEISQSHPLLGRSSCTLDNVHTISVPTIPVMLHILSTILPNFIIGKASSRPVKLVVVDSLAELFHLSGKTTTSTLVERSHNIAHIASLLHTLASSYGIAIVALNEVIDSMERSNANTTIEPTDIIYSEQSRWFNSTPGEPGENRKESSLGLTWANQINNRIILTRTGRRRHLNEDEMRTSYKRLRNEQNVTCTAEISGAFEQETLLIRRLTIVFCSIAYPRTLDYIITRRGFSVLATVVDEIYKTLNPNGEVLDTTPSFIGPESNEDVDWDTLLPAEYCYEGVDWDALEKDLAEFN